MKKITLLVLTAALLPLPGEAASGALSNRIEQQVEQAVQTDQSSRKEDAIKLINAIRYDRTQEALELIPQTDINFVYEYIDCDAEDCFGVTETPLLMAIQRNNKEVAAALLKDKRIDVNMYGGYEGKPLYYAIKDNRIGIAVMLLSHPDIDLDVTVAHSTPAHWAVGKYEILNELVKSQNFKKEMLNMRNRDGETPLHLCRDKRVAELLIENGADVNAKDNLGQTPLFERIPPEMAEFLIAKGAKVNARDKKDTTPVYGLARYDSKWHHLDEWSLAMLDVFLRHGADVHLVSRVENRTPLHSMASEDRVDMLKRLWKAKQQGADIDFNVLNRSNETPLHTAVKEWRIEAAKFLVNVVHVDTNIKNNAGQTAEDIAKEKGNWESIFAQAKTAR